MAARHIERTQILRDLGEGLILRRSTSKDTEALVEFNSRVHSDDGWEEPDQFVGAWTRDLMTKNHPTFDPQDFTIVEDIHKGQIVSTLCLISQTWTYAGVPFKVGRPELVGTHPEYRNRGLIRAQFEEIHRWSAARRELVQVITGIPYYYRLFGYEMALNLGGGRIGYLPHLPKLEEGQEEAFLIRPANKKDVGFIQKTYDTGIQRSMVSCQRNPDIWRYEISGHDPLSVNGRALCIIETPQGEPVGFLAHPRMLWGPSMAATTIEVKSGSSWLEVTPSVIRYLQKIGESYAEQQGKFPFQSFRLALGEEHPAYEAFADQLPRVYPPYAYYVRVPDLRAFIQTIRPVLEERLANSIAVGYTGELNISFYRTGLQLIFEHGRLSKVDSWTPVPRGESGDAVFPQLTFTQLVFGYRSLRELEYAFPDCTHRGDTARVLLSVLFPKQNSDIWPLN
jgi:GNAT superfamily N-acetyltransferase